MDEIFRSKLRRIHRVNRVLWSAIFADIIILIIIVSMFDNFDLLTEPVLYNMKIFNDVSLIIVVFFLFLIIYLKRTYLLPQKMIERAEKKDLHIEAADVKDFVQEFGTEVNILAKTLIIMRRYYMVIWSIANLIVLIAFISYILSLQMRSFLIYSVVGIFSLIINFPYFSIVERCYYKISNK